MIAQWTPMRWPNAWTDPAALTLLKGTAIDFLLVGKGDAWKAVRERAVASGLRVADPDSLPTEIALVKGEWPGVKMGRGASQMSAGPTGVAWVDSNGWAIRLSAALDPGRAVWVDAPPPEDSRMFADSYLVAIADCAAYGGRWVVTLGDSLAKGIAEQRADAMGTWKRIVASAGFFSARKEWSSYAPQALVGVVSDFSGRNEFFSRELLNLLGRAGQHYTVLPKSRISSDSFAGLRAIIYPDTDNPSDALRKQGHDFVEAGGLLIGAPQWGGPPGTPTKSAEGERYAIRQIGKGRIALSYGDPDDPYLWANDSVTMVSHRYDLVRFWNGGATGSHYTTAPDGKQSIVHLLFYADRGPDAASVRIAGHFGAVKAFTVDQSPLKVGVQVDKDAVEVHLPQVSQYVALELS